MEELTLTEKLWRLLHIQVFYYSYLLINEASPIKLFVLFGFVYTLPFVILYIIEGIVTLYEMIRMLVATVQQIFKNGS